MSSDEIDQNPSILQKGLHSLGNGFNFWIMSIILVVVISCYVHFFMTDTNNFLARKHIDIGGFFTFKLNYGVLFALLWFCLLLMVMMN